MKNAPTSRRALLGFLGAGAAASMRLWGDSTPVRAMETGSAPPLPLRGPLPEFAGITRWLNTPKPLTVADLKGNVVLVHIWTFACINCQRTLPYVVRWHETYAARGLRVVGVHTPEFAYERDIENIRRAMEQHRITYANAVDNRFATWKAYNNEYWPHLFLADRQGRLRYDHIGEGAYEATEQAIRTLLDA
ncbi:redoxin family protein [Gloeobacter morelensis]|uniref:Redoxin domain-containing protein n=1 Tax=Gloeobacter morelensis MG652769 TaxID=2781736 RepID=A0ABY3PNF5_9CYAN|nr:redoxin family protein [Gloeobacter morelensis]UFP95202.1 redoxin domain-containing protein [Gloeobacter morelensis MG652769]